MFQKSPIAFLDFDGVLCDSVREAFVSSEIAYRRLIGADTAEPAAGSNSAGRPNSARDAGSVVGAGGSNGEDNSNSAGRSNSARDAGSVVGAGGSGSASGPGLGSITTASSTDEPGFEDRLAVFRSWRPFVTRGAEFVLLQELMARGEKPSEQAYIAAREALPAGRMDEFHAALYQVREELLEQDREGWLSLHRLYPVASSCLPEAADNPRVYIISTKASEYVAAILSGNGIEWPPERLLYPGKRTKLDLLTELLHERGETAAYLVDDHPDNLPEAFVARDGVEVGCYLAAWGYAADEVLARTSLPKLGEQQLVDLVRATPPA